MIEPMTPSRNSNNPFVWVQCSYSDDDTDVTSYNAELSDSNEPFCSIFGEGQIKVFEDKITFSQNGFTIAFIKPSDDLTYSTLYGENNCYLKFSKYGKETFIQLNQQALDAIDQSLKRVVFKQDFVGSYEIISFIGNGSFSQVTLAKNKRDGKNYAVKSVQKSRITLSQQNKKELLNEINLLRRINHDKVLKSYEFFSTENAYKMILENYSGGTLEQKLEKSQGFTLYQVCDIIKQILQGFQYLHSQNIIHRDLKPDNVLFCDNDSFDVVISDIGLSQDINQEFLFTKCGTPGYVAPEILNSVSGTDYGVKSDIFSCGCLFYRLAVGKPLFSGKSHVEVLEENKKCKVDLLCPEFKQLPQQIQKVIENMLQVNPNNRLSAQEALDTLFYKLNPQQQEYFCKNLLKVSGHQRKNTLTQDSGKQLINIQRKQRNSVQMTNSFCLGSNSNSPKGSQSSIGSNSSLNKTPTNSSQKDKPDIVRKSQYHKQESTESNDSDFNKIVSPKIGSLRTPEVKKKIVADSKSIAKSKLSESPHVSDSPQNSLKKYTTSSLSSNSKTKTPNTNAK